jgi:hypothetical protein
MLTHQTSGSLSIQGVHKQTNKQCEWPQRNGARTRLWTLGVLPGQCKPKPKHTALLSEVYVLFYPSLAICNLITIPFLARMCSHVH